MGRNGQKDNRKAKSKQDDNFSILCSLPHSLHSREGLSYFSYLRHTSVICALEIKSEICKKKEKKLGEGSSEKMRSICYQRTVVQLSLATRIVRAANAGRAIRLSFLSFDFLLLLLLFCQRGKCKTNFSPKTLRLEHWCGRGSEDSKAAVPGRGREPQVRLVACAQKAFI